MTGRQTLIFLNRFSFPRPAGNVTTTARKHKETKNTRFAWAGKCLEDMRTGRLGSPLRVAGGGAYVSCMYKLNDNTQYTV